MSRPGDHHRCECLGTVELTHLVRGDTTAFLRRIDDGAGTPCLIMVWPPPGLAIDVRPGDRLWLRGSLRCDPTPGRRSRHDVQAEPIAIMRRHVSVHGYEEHPACHR